ncbi:MAG: ATP-binding cassette domain-containing protein [Betaproteobacteria bacterium]|jgi:phosphonate transport system ATP-binding protein
MSAEPNVIRLQGMGVRVHGADLLADIDLVVKPQERIAIIGANGAGKTTLVKTLTAMMRPTSGALQVLGEDLARENRPDRLRALRSRIGQVFQGLHLVGRLSVHENVLIGALGRCESLLTLGRYFPAEERDRAQAALEAVGMGHAAKLRVDRLSGGERQKVAVARALNQDPQLILADEPTANLDPVAAEEVADLLARIATEKQVTLITVAHTLKLLPNLAKRVIGMRAGRIVFDAPIGDIDDNQLQQLYRGAPA